MSSRLMTLPVELRLIIYRLVFNTEDCTEDSRIDLKGRFGPRSDLLATCSRIFMEAESAYDTAFDSFRSKPRRFHISIDYETSISYSSASDMIQNIAGPLRLPLARSLELHMNRPGREDCSFTIKFGISDLGMMQVDVREKFNFSNSLHQYLFRDLLDMISTRALVETKRNGDNTAIVVESCLQTVHSAERRWNGFKGFWRGMDRG